MKGGKKYIPGRALTTIKFNQINGRPDHMLTHPPPPAPDGRQCRCGMSAAQREHEGGAHLKVQNVAKKNKKVGESLDSMTSTVARSAEMLGCL